MKKILINAKYPEEKRVAIVEGDRLADFYVEVAGKEHLRGNIYKATIARIEPALQAAFVDFGQKKQGFLQFREITPEYLPPKGKGKKKIQDVLQKGQELIVQVERDERDTKGATLTTYISLPGRYLVMMPGRETVGISRKIEEKKDRERVKKLLESLKLPPKMGFILRTAGVDKTADDLANDLKYLEKLWASIEEDAKKAHAPALIYKEQDIAVRTVRDYLTSDVNQVLVDEQEAYRNVKAFLKQTVPWRKINVKLYREKRPIFEASNMEEQIGKINDRYVRLPSKGYMVFDKTEALTAIDVNSGRSRKEKNIEQTAFQTNMEAAEEVARQLRLRDIGGLIVIDFIDMESSKNRRQVEARLKEALAADKAHTDISGISRFGTVEMTRERLRTAYFESTYQKCPTCDGTGVVKAEEMLALAAFRDLQLKAWRGGTTRLICRLPVGSANHIINTRREELVQLEKDFKLKIDIVGDSGMAPGQYALDIEKPVEKPAEKSSEKSSHN
jgi:ribonuclease E